MIRRSHLCALVAASFALPHVALAGAKVIAVGKTRTSIAVGHDPRLKWSADDRVCVVQAAVDVVCGIVLKTTPKGAIVRLDTIYENIQAGDNIRRQPGTRGPAAAELLDSSPSGANNSRPFAISLGVDLGPTFFFPVLHFQVSPIRQFALGIEPIYFRGSTVDGSVSAIGGFGTLTFYLDGWYHGFNVQGGMGFFNITAESSLAGSQSKSVLAGFGTVGYRLAWEHGMHVGVSAGLFVLGDPQFLGLEVKAAGVQPIASFDFGFSF